MTLHEHLASVCWWSWTGIANHLWQSTLFLLLIVSMVILLRDAPAKSRYAVWLVGATKFALPLSVFAILGQWLNLNSFFSPATLIDPSITGGVDVVNIFSSERVGAIATSEHPIGHPEVYCVLTVIWLAGASALFGLWWKRSKAFRTSFGYHNSPTNEREATLLNNAQATVGLKMRVNLVISDSILEPLVLGTWNPIVVLPRGLSERLTDTELEMVLVHELTHVARKDNLVGVLQMALCCLLWFHPLVWLIKRKLLEERELACDEAAVMSENEPEIYASGLLKVVQHGLHFHQSAGLAKAASSNLSKRMESIMKNKTKTTRIQRWLMGSTFAALILACMLGLAMARPNSVSGFIGEPNATPQPGKADLKELVRDSKDVAYRIVEADDSPVKIVEAFGQEIKSADFTRLTGKVKVQAKSGKITEFPKMYSAPEVKIVNNSGKSVSRAILVVRDPAPAGSGNMRFVLLGNEKAPITISPGATHTVNFRETHSMMSDQYWLLEFSDMSNFYVTVARVWFDDGTIWETKEKADF